MDEKQRKAFFAIIEEKRKIKDAQIVVTKKIKEWEVIN